MMRSSFLLLAAVLLVRLSCCSGKGHKDKASARQCLGLSTPPFAALNYSNERTGLAAVSVFFGLQELTSIKDVCSNLYIGVRYTTWSNAAGVVGSTDGTSLLPDAHRKWSRWFTWKAASFIEMGFAEDLPKQIPNDMYYMFQVHIKRGKHFRRARITHTTGRLSNVVYTGSQVPMAVEPLSPSTRTVRENSTFSLECIATGKPLPQVTWVMSLESPPTITEGVEVLDATLHIDRFQAQHRGTYMCIAVQYKLGFDGVFEKNVETVQVKIELARE